MLELLTFIIVMSVIVVSIAFLKRANEGRSWLNRLRPGSFQDDIFRKATNQKLQVETSKIKGKPKNPDQKKIDTYTEQLATIRTNHANPAEMEVAAISGTGVDVSLLELGDAEQVVVTTKDSKTSGAKVPESASATIGAGE